MKQIPWATFVFFAVLLTACQSATPIPPPTITMDAEFTLAPDQIATIIDTGLTIRLIGVSSDERCPSEIECVISGPVSISLSVQTGNGDPTSIKLQTFTDNAGRAPDFEFEKIKNYVVYEEYLIRVTGVLPYPASPSKPIESSDYRVTFTVTQE